MGRIYSILKLCKKFRHFVAFSKIVFIFCITVLIMISAIVQFRDECYHAPIPPSEARLRKCVSKRSVDKHDLITFGKNKAQSSKLTLLNTSLVEAVAKYDKETISEAVLESRKTAHAYFATNRRSTKKACFTMFEEEEQKAEMTFAPEEKPQIARENKFFMKTSPDRRTRWIFYKHKDPSNELEIQWCPLFKSASSPWMAVFTKLSGALTHKTEMKIKSGKATFMNLAKDFRLFASDGVRSTDKTIPKYSMVVVRHPFSRVLSAYRDKLERIKGREFYNKKYSKTIIQRFRRARRFESKLTDVNVKTNPLWLTLALELQQHNNHNSTIDGVTISRQDNNKPHEAPTFEEFCQYLLTVDPKRMDEHWRPQYLDCSPCHHTFDLILKVEDIDKDKAQIFKLLGYDAHNNMTSSKYQELENVWNRWSNRSPDENAGRHNESFYFSQLSKSLVEKLYNLYEPDFKLFGYSPQKYFEMSKSG